MDPLSDLLSLLKPRSVITGGVAIRPGMAIQWPQHEGIKCYAMVAGQCWLTVSGVSEPVQLQAGDCYLLPPGPPFCLATSLTALPVDYREARAAGQVGRDVALDETDSCYLVGGHFLLNGSHADLLQGSLAPIVHITRTSDQAAMFWALERMAAEIRHPQAGSTLITQQLAYTLLIQALRLHLSDAKHTGTGWLFALADKPLSAALGHLHANPAFPWTLQELASRVGMSRSGFALRFKEKMGTTPIEYLTRWRMMLACEKLENSTNTLPQIAIALGYESESAFSKAFKRVIGCSPRQHSLRSRTSMPL